MSLRQFCLSLLALVSCTASLAAQTSISSIQPTTCRPGETTRLAIRGKELDASLKITSSSSQAQVELVSVEAELAYADVTLPADSRLGAFGLWLAAAGGPLKQQVLLADDLPAVADNGDNHSMEKAQALPGPAAVDGFSDGPQSDFYSLQVTAGQRVAIEILTQSLLSPMDPVIRLLDAEGQTLHLADDTSVGPDNRFSHTFATAGQVWIEVHDSRHAAAGSPYHLRVGDFPILSHSQPLAVQAGAATELSFACLDDHSALPQTISQPSLAAARLTVSTRTQTGSSAAWVPVLVSPYPQIVEPDLLSGGPAAESAASDAGTADESEKAEPWQLPLGITGQLSEAGQVDSYPLQGTAGQTVRVASRTRSVGCPTLLQMRLYDAANQLVAETKVSNADEWSFDFAFPTNDAYRLEVQDLLRRGGPAFGYWIEIAPAPSFQIALKADAATRQEFALELEHGACAVDLQIARFGYDGEIDLALQPAPAGLRLLNPRIAAKAAEHKLLVAVGDAWQADSMPWLALTAHAVDDPTIHTMASSHDLQRVKTPFVLLPTTWNDGKLALTGVGKSESPFALSVAAPPRWPRPLTKLTAAMTLQRVQEAFKGNVSLVPGTLPDGWQASLAIDKDTYTATFTRPTSLDTWPASLPLQFFGELAGRGRIESFELPIEWFDPLQVELELPQPVLRGGAARVVARIHRDGNDPQPVTLTPATMPAGLTLPESVTVAADQELVEFDMQITADAQLEPAATLQLTATSKHADQEFSVLSMPLPLTVLDSPQQLSVYPASIDLSDPRGQQQLVVTGVDASGKPRDWTRWARFQVVDPPVVDVRDGVVHPQADGQTTLNIQVGGARASVPVNVTASGSSRTVDFESEVLVALSKQGCNSGACHGSPSGKGGFRLSLRAFDMQLDQLTLIREDYGRRVNPLDPEQSLLLLKPLMKVAHGGGKQLHPTDAAYAILRDWIREGAHPDPADTPRVVRLELFPNQKQVLAVGDGGQQLAVTAHFADGRRRDVTELVAYETSDTSVATVDEHGFVTPHARGEIAVLVRFLEHIESLPLMFVDSQPGFEWQAPTPNNYIDELVHAKLKQLEYLPSETCSDAEFIRRASLDVLGILPTVAETSAFLADDSPDKREQLIDRLLERDEYPKFWALKWGDLLKLTSKLVGDEGVYKYHRWLEESLRVNMPYDEFATDLLTGSGSTLANPPANFYRTATDMNECVETISQVFLGARLQCAKCHNHPFERWTQDNYYGLGAFFNRVERRQTQRPGEMFVYTGFTGDVTQPRTGQIMQPWLPQAGSISPPADQDRRLAFAAWLVADDNPYFARIEANRIWSQLFARGIVDPIDDFRDSNPPSNAPLLDALAQDFVDSGYDRKHLLRTILRSRTYQASYRTNDFNQADSTYCSHQEPRLLSAEQLLDAINQTLNLEQTFGGLPAGTRATQLPAPDLVKVDFLKVFGQPERSTVCACERSDDSNLGMAIELFNGPMIHEKLRDGNNRFRTSLAAGKSVDECLQELYLAALCRPPSDIELEAARQHCAQSPDPAAGLEDVCWALFNTDEFLFQH